MNCRQPGNLSRAVPSPSCDISTMSSNNWKDLHANRAVTSCPQCVTCHWLLATWHVTSSGQQCKLSGKYQTWMISWHIAMLFSTLVKGIDTKCGRQNGNVAIIVPALVKNTGVTTRQKLSTNCCMLPAINAVDWSARLIEQPLTVLSH